MPAPAPVAQPPAAGGHGGALAKVSGNRNFAILAAGGTVGVLALLTLFKGKSSAAASDATPASTTQPYDSTESDMWNTWQNDYEQLQQQIGALQPSQTSTGGSTNPPVPVPVQRPPLPTPAPPARTPSPLPKPPSQTGKPIVGGTKPASVKVQRGDTLSGIAAKYGDSMATIKKLNPTYWTNKKYKNGNLIFAGDTVRLR